MVVVIRMRRGWNVPRIKFTCGVYNILLVRDGRRYIGSSVKVEQRFSEHRCSLNRGEHHSRYLQRAWDKYGEASFQFEILEICALDKLLEREQHHIDNNKHLFNTAKVTGTRRGVPTSLATRIKIGNHFRGKKLSEEIRARMRNAQRKRAAEITPEERQRLSDRMRITMSRPEMRRLASEHAIKINNDPKVGRKISKTKRGRPGWIPSEATRKKRSDALKGRVLGPLSEKVKRKISKAVKKALTVNPRRRGVDGTFLARI